MLFCTSYVDSNVLSTIFFHVYPHMTKFYKWNMSKLYVVTVRQGFHRFKEVQLYYCFWDQSFS